MQRIKQPIPPILWSYFVYSSKQQGSVPRGLLYKIVIPRAGPGGGWQVLPIFRFTPSLSSRQRCGTQSFPSGTDRTTTKTRSGCMRNCASVQNLLYCTCDVQTGYSVHNVLYML